MNIPFLTKNKDNPLNSRDYSGKPYDRKLGAGPVESVERSCTDWSCYITFILFWSAFGGNAWAALLNGKPELLATPFDASGSTSQFSYSTTLSFSGNRCGLDDKYADFPYIYFATPFADWERRTVCVSECPNW